MNKKIIFFTVFVLILFTVNVFALPVGGPLKTVGQGKWDVTLESSSVGDRDLVPGSTNNTNVSTGVVQERDAIAGKVTYGISNEWDVYLKGGTGSDLEVDTTWSDGSKTKLEFDNGGMFGGGTKYIHTFDNDVLVGGDFQFIIYASQEIRKITEGTLSTTITQKGRADFNEVQLSFFCGKKYTLTDNIIVTPYTGLLFNGVNLSTEQLKYRTAFVSYTLPAFEMDQDDNVGLFIGGDVAISERLFISLEARFIADEAISGSFSYRF